MTPLEFLLLASIAPVGALIIAGLMLFIVKRDAEREERRRSAGE